MKDIELAKLFGLPTSTLADWKSKKNLNGNLKFLLYKFISSLPDEMIKERIEAIKVIEDIEVVGNQELITKIFENKDTFEILGGFTLLDNINDLSTQTISNILARNKMAILKNEDEQYIVIHFYFPYNSNSLRKISHLQKEYDLLNETYNVDKIYLVLSNTKMFSKDESSVFSTVDNLEILDVEYFSSKLYDRKNVVFWNEGKR